MLKKDIGIAMYTVQESVSGDMAGTLCGLAEMGYDSIEFYGPPVFERAAIVDSLRVSGLAFTGWHVEWRDLQPDRFDATLQYLTDVACPMAIVPCLGGKWGIAHGPGEECEETWKRHIDWLNATAARLAARGLRLAYHNHSHEFELRYGGKPLFNYLFDSLAEDIVMELDTGNCIEAGVDPLRVLDRYRDRQIVLHLKPFSRTRGFDAILGDADDKNDCAALLDKRRHDFLWRLVESESRAIPEMENARLCMEGIARYL